MSVLRAGLLEGARVCVRGASPGGSVAARLRELGAELGEAEPAALVFDARPSFGAGGAGAVSETLGAAWQAVREVAAEGIVPRGTGGRIVLLAPRHGAGAFAGAARDGLESVARTLSVEWARFGIRAVAVAPGERLEEAELAELVAFLLSAAGGYLSGCRLAAG